MGADADAVAGGGACLDRGQHGRRRRCDARGRRRDAGSRWHVRADGGTRSSRAVRTATRSMATWSVGRHRRAAVPRRDRTAAPGPRSPRDCASRRRPTPAARRTTGRTVVRMGHPRHIPSRRSCDSSSITSRPNGPERGPWSQRDRRCVVVPVPRTGTDRGAERPVARRTRSTVHTAARHADAIATSASPPSHSPTNPSSAAITCQGGVPGWSVARSTVQATPVAAATGTRTRMRSSAGRPNRRIDSSGWRMASLIPLRSARPTLSAIEDQVADRASGDDLSEDPREQDDEHGSGDRRDDAPHDGLADIAREGQLPVGHRDHDGGPPRQRDQQRDQREQPDRRASR